jgi:hypothetical protein
MLITQVTAIECMDAEGNEVERDSEYCVQHKALVVVVDRASRRERDDIFIAAVDVIFDPYLPYAVRLAEIIRQGAELIADTPHGASSEMDAFNRDLRKGDK